MSLLARLMLSSMLWIAGSAIAADQYEVTIGEPLPGTSMPRGRVGLGIAVNIDKNWDELTGSGPRRLARLHRDDGRRRHAAVSPAAYPQLPEKARHLRLPDAGRRTDDTQWRNHAGRPRVRDGQGQPGRGHGRVQGWQRDHDA
ncbi:hypothetical protein LP420_40740 [Massilia sp. B-10]|nr:hypothetical protein LP420_40740 [Massilia sp. B-10]UUZ54483.1 hypothetical protein LP419_40135 [Massilia sp. H-1]